MAIAIGHELEEQNMLLEEIDDEVGTTNQRMRAAQKRMQHILRDRGSLRITCALFGLATLLVLIIGIAWRLF